MGIVVFLANALTAIDDTPAKRTLVEYRHVGDDALSQRLTIEVETAFEHSPNFTPSSGKKPGTLIVTVPDNVGWAKKSGRTKALYTVEYTSVDGKKLLKKSGSCWEDELSKCALNIVKNAKFAVCRMRERYSASFYKPIAAADTRDTGQNWSTAQLARSVSETPLLHDSNRGSFTVRKGGIRFPQ